MLRELSKPATTDWTQERHHRGRGAPDNGHVNTRARSSTWRIGHELEASNNYLWSLLPSNEQAIL